VLEAAGLVQVVRTRRVRALTESFYGRTARLFVIKSTDELSHARVRLSPKDAELFQRRLEKLASDVRAASSLTGEEYELMATLYPTGELT
jgi:hypothetical protein